MDDLAEMRRLTKLLPIQVRDSLARAFGLTTLHRLLLSRGGPAAHKLTTGPSADKSGVESPAFSDGATRGKKNGARFSEKSEPQVALNFSICQDDGQRAERRVVGFSAADRIY